MSYVIQVVLSNARHPEYGQFTIPFPIPQDAYDDMVEALKNMEIGDPILQDCHVDELESSYSILKRLEKTNLNLDELDYLAKRLDSFDNGEAAQFQGMACKLGVSNIKDFINLTFCCQQATVITDFSDLAAVGRNHYMNLHGGSASVDELNALDGKKTARQLIESGSGTITPYGVVYDNGMKLEQVYDGRFFPCYYYKPNAITIAVTSKAEPEDTEHITWLYLIKHRGIARDVVAHFAKAGLLYEDAEYHNAVFVGTDTDGVPHHAHKRSANSYGKAFRLNVEGSDPRYSFHYVGTDRSLYVFEAPIDMLSYITLYPENWQRHSYVACCGTSIQPVLQMLEQAPQLDTVLLCLDNDETGHQASRRMREQLEMRYSVERLIPESKDWNDDLTLSIENAQGFAMNEMR